MAENNSAPVAEWQGESYRMDLGKGDPNYGTPVAGSKTDIRGRKAGVNISNEILDLVEIIYRVGVPYPGCIRAVSFGHLFELYTRISSKVVGMLVRARRHGLVLFTGEMLYQGQDNDKIIKLIKIPATLFETLGLTEEPGPTFNYSK